MSYDHDDSYEREVHVKLVIVWITYDHVDLAHLIVILLHSYILFKNYVSMPCRLDSWRAKLHREYVTLPLHSKLSDSETENSTMDYRYVDQQASHRAGNQDDQQALNPHQQHLQHLPHFSHQHSLQPPSLPHQHMHHVGQPVFVAASHGREAYNNRRQSGQDLQSILEGTLLSCWVELSVDGVRTGLYKRFWKRGFKNATTKKCKKTCKNRSSLPKMGVGPLSGWRAHTQKNIHGLKRNSTTGLTSSQKKE